jgi:hypothetical protein
MLTGDWGFASFIYPTSVPYESIDVLYPRLVIRSSIVVVKLANMCSLAVFKDPILMAVIRESSKIAYLRA